MYKKSTQVIDPVVHVRVLRDSGNAKITRNALRVSESLVLKLDTISYMEEEEKIKEYKLHNCLVFIIPQCDISQM